MGTSVVEPPPVVRARQNAPRPSSDNCFVAVWPERALALKQYGMAGRDMAPNVMGHSGAS